MATPTVKSTYALDLKTLERLEELTRRWGVTKSEALRRAIALAAAEQDQERALDALNRLHESLHLDASRARKWMESVRSERRASSRRSEGR